MRDELGKLKYSKINLEATFTNQEFHFNPAIEKIIEK